MSPATLNSPHDPGRTYQNLGKFLHESGARHFTAAEVAKLEVPPLKLWSRIVPTIRILMDLRAELNARKSGAYIWVTSGYRSPEHNHRVGGGSGSLHLSFNAIDFVPMRGQEMISLTEAIGIIEHHPLYSFLGVGLYNTFIHVDTRGLLGSSGVRFR